jgi:ankyrin repeat protein
MKDKHGNTKLAKELKDQKSEDIIVPLIEQNPNVIQEMNNDIACQIYNSETVILQLLNSFPEAAAKKDNSGYYPLHHVCWRNHYEMLL